MKDVLNLTVLFVALVSTGCATVPSGTVRWGGGAHEYHRSAAKPHTDLTIENCIPGTVMYIDGYGVVLPYGAKYSIRIDNAHRWQYCPAYDCWEYPDKLVEVVVFDLYDQYLGDATCTVPPFMYHRLTGRNVRRRHWCVRGLGAD